MGRDNGVDGARADAERRTAVEAEPADPEQAEADKSHGQIEGREIFLAIAGARANHQRRDQAGDAGVDMDDRSAGEIDKAPIAQEAAAPNPMRAGDVDDEQPDGAEQGKSGEFHPVGGGAANQRAGDHREGHLIGGEQHFRNGLGAAADRFGPDPAEAASAEKSPISAPAPRKARL